MKVDQFRKRLGISLILAVLLPFLYGVIAFELLGEALQFNVPGLAETSGLEKFVRFMGSKIGLILFILAILAFLAASLIPAWLVSGQGVSDEEISDEDLGEDDNRETGTVKWFNVNKGFGFITRDQGDDIFVHFRSIRGRGHRTLRQGQRVRFLVKEGDKGLQAEDVSVAH